MLFVIWAVFGIAAAIVAQNKGRSGCGWFVLVSLLGPIGFILSLVVAKNQPAIEQEAIDSGEMKKCPYCAEIIKAEAIKCRYCGTDVPLHSSPAAPESPNPRNESVTVSGQTIAQIEPDDFSSTPKRSWPLFWVVCIWIVIILVILIYPTVWKNFLR